MTAQAASLSHGELLGLARERTDDARERLMLAVAALCDARPPDGTLSPVLTDIFLTLARQAERDVRKALSSRLAHADWAPRALVSVLALDEIEIARPILASSPVLEDEDLMRVLVEATLEHQVEIARRPWVSGQVADAIIDKAEPAGLCALAANHTAEISQDGLRRLVEHSRRTPGLRSPLVRHPSMNPALARQMYAWVGQALRHAIVERFQVDPASLSAAVNAAVDEALNPPPTPTDSTADREEMDRRLVAKLQAAGQLRAGMLIRSAREGRLGLFTHGLATLSGFPLAEIKRALSARSSEALFYACAAVGVDRAAFSGLLADIRRINRGFPSEAGQTTWLTSGVSTASAARAFRSLIDTAAV